MTIAGIRAKIPTGIAYFDMYLRGYEQDFLVWERRSRVFKVIDDLTAIFKKVADQKDYFRYKFTQILDKDANVLKSYPHFQDSLREFAQQNKLDYPTMLYYKCYQGQTGCDSQSIVQGEADTRFDGNDGAQNLGMLPFF